jgi:hypothetical protein
MTPSGDVELVEISPAEEPSGAPDGVFVLRHEPLIITSGTRTFLTGLIVVVAVGSDVLFFPHMTYMAIYGAFVAGLCIMVLRRLWKARSAGPTG